MLPAKKIINKFKTHLDYLKSTYLDYQVQEYIKFLRPLSLESSDTEIHTLISSRHLFYSIISLRSFLRYYTKINLTIHDDGTLNKETYQIINRHFPQARIISRKEADSQINIIIKDYPVSREFRKKNIIIAQAIDFSIFSNTKKIINIDSDIIFFEKPEKIIEWIGDDQNSCLYSFEKDPLAPKIGQTKITLLQPMPFNFAPNLCGGFLCYFKDVLDLENLEKYCSYVKQNCTSYLYRAQTINSMLIGHSKYNQSILSSRYQNWGELNSSIKPIFIHYWQSYIGTSDRLKYSKDLHSSAKEFAKEDGIRNLLLKSRLKVLEKSLRQLLKYSVKTIVSKFKKIIFSDQGAKFRSLFDFNQLTSLANKYGSDKGTLHFNRHNYTSLYSRYLKPLRNKEITLLEIGLCRKTFPSGQSDCPSLRIWYEYFNKAKILGLDIEKFPQMNLSRVTILQGDQGSEKDLKQALKAMNNELDVVIDDGSHASNHQQLTLATLFPALKKGGLYFLEDLDWQPSKLEPPDCIKTKDVLLKFLESGIYFSEFSSPEQNEYLQYNIAFCKFFKCMQRLNPTANGFCVLRKK